MASFVKFPFGDVSADGWDTIQAQKLAASLAAASDAPATLRANTGGFGGVFDVARDFGATVTGATTFRLNESTYASSLSNAGKWVLVTP